MLNMTEIIALASFALVSSITPGPNNMMATSSGANFGYARTIPQVAGVTLGFTLLLWAMAAGIGALMLDYPRLAQTLAVAGWLYLAWLSWQLLRAAALGGGPAERAMQRPLSLTEAALFQLANPKAWMMALSAASSFMVNHQDRVTTALIIGIIFAVINFPCVSAWALLGAGLRNSLIEEGKQWRMRLFNLLMGLSLALTTVWLVMNAH